MTDLVLRIGASNLCISLALAIVAWVVQAKSKRPHVAHLLWLLVVVKLVTPPIVDLPVFTVPWPSAATFEMLAADTGPTPAGVAAAASDLNTEETGAASLTAAAHGKTWLALAWLFGSAFVLAWSLVRIYRFNRLLKMASEAASPEVQGVAAEIAHRLALRSVPTIYTTSARLSPMVWWIGRRVRIVIPAALLREMDAGDLRWILAHELAHVRRRDHLVRWLEWLACVAFWWNPVAWWARRNLRKNEEICCDALVLESLRPAPHNYANALMSVVEFLTSTAIRPPAMASSILSGGFLERRFRMIVSSYPLPRTSRWLLALILVCAVGLLPLGVVYAQDFKAVERKLGAAVEAGELTLDQAKIMMDALRHAAKDDLEAKKRRYVEYQRRIEAAVKKGDLSREEAEKKLIEARKAMFGQPRAKGHDLEALKRRYEEYQCRIEAAVKEGKLSREDAEKKLIQARKDMFGQPRDKGRELMGHFKKLGVDWVDRIPGILTENGLKREQVEPAMGGLLRVVYEVKEEGEKFALDPRLRAYFSKEVRLTDEQVKLVVGMARRLAYGMK